MNRSPVVSFLVLAVVVGFGASLNDSHLTAIGERLLAVQEVIKADTTYAHVPRLHTAGARLAFLEEGDSGGWGGDPDGYGSIYTPTEGTYPTTIYPESYYYTEQDYFAPQIDYSTPNTDVWPPDNYDYNYETTPMYDVDGGGSFYVPSVSGETGSAASRAGSVINNDISGTIDLQKQYNPLVYPSKDSQGALKTDNYIYADNSVYSVYGSGVNSYNYYTYAPAWYETALPGWGTAVIPLLPTQYRPTGYDCYGSGTSISGVLGIAGAGIGLSLGASYSDHSPCYTYSPSGYGSAASVPLSYGAYPTYGSASASQPPRQAPTCTIKLSDASIEYGGQTVLAWSSYGATQASLNGFGQVPLSGTRALNSQTTSRTYGLTVTGQGGTGACYTTLSVGAAPTCAISASPSSIRRGETTNLSWNSSNAVSASLAGLGTVPTQSGRIVAPTQNTTFVLSVRSAGGGTGTCSVIVGVQ